MAGKFLALLERVAARNAGADFTLVAGDTFEDNGADRVLVQMVADDFLRKGSPGWV